MSKHKVLVASVCPQSLPFFAVKFGVDITDAAHKLCGFLKSIGEQVGVTSSGGFCRLKTIKGPHIMLKNHLCFFHSSWVFFLKMISGLHSIEIRQIFPSLLWLILVQICAAKLLIFLWYTALYLLQASGNSPQPGVCLSSFIGIKRKAPLRQGGGWGGMPKIIIKMTHFLLSGSSLQECSTCSTPL